MRVKPRARASAIAAACSRGGEAGAPVCARDEELAEVREPRVAGRREGAIGGQEADVADQLAVVLGDAVPDVVLAEQAAAGGRVSSEADGGVQPSGAKAR